MATLRLFRENDISFQSNSRHREGEGGGEEEESVNMVWDVFLRHLEIEHLGPILCEVFADLLPYFSTDSSGILFHYFSLFIHFLLFQK